MQVFDNHNAQTLPLEAPGDFLSGLLAVSEACVLIVNSGVLEYPPRCGCWRVLAPLEGSLRLAAGELSLPLAAGQAAAVSGEEELTLLAGADSRVCLITLCGSAADQVFQSCKAQGGLFFERGGAVVGRVLRVLLSRHRTVPAREASELAYSMLMGLYGTSTAGPAGKNTMPPVVEAALGIIRRDYAFLDGIAELAERLEVSQEYLTRCFCKYIGVTPGKYLNQVRIENAKLLLRQGGHSIQFVSDACGFANANYFARVFRTNVGINPRDYARSQQAPAFSDDVGNSLYVL